MTDHTFLFQTGLWLARGVYWDQDDIAYDLRGETRCVRSGNEWLNLCWMEVELPVPARFENRYLLGPQQGKVVPWTSYNPALGMLQGQFCVVEDAILSSYVSACGKYSGSEVLLWQGGGYRNLGTRLRTGVRMSSWEAFLRPA